LKDLTKIFAKILQDLQGFHQDLAKILGKILALTLDSEKPRGYEPIKYVCMYVCKILTGSLLGSFKILEDPMRIFESSSRNFF